MKWLGMDFITSPALEPGQMLVRSGNLVYGWDLAKDGTDYCVTIRIEPDGTLTVIDALDGDGESNANR